MCHSKLFVPASVGVLAARLLFAYVPLDRRHASLSAIVTRRAAVEQSYRGYERRLQQYHGALAKALRESGSNLRGLIASPAARRHGYGVLPQIIANPSPGTDHADSSPARSYSWPATER